MGVTIGKSYINDAVKHRPVDQHVVVSHRMDGVKKSPAGRPTPVVMLSQGQVNYRISDQEKLHQMIGVPSRELTYPTWEKGISSSKVPWEKDMLVPERVRVLWKWHQQVGPMKQFT